MKVKTWLDLEKFKGNILSWEEKIIRLVGLQSLIKKNWEYNPDKEMIPYLERLNAIWFIATTQCCSGHFDNPKRRSGGAHIDFRSALSVEDTINKVIRPWENLQDPPSSVQITAENVRLRYILWLDKRWKNQLEQLIKICKEVEVIK